MNTEQPASTPIIDGTVDAEPEDFFDVEDIYVLDQSIVTLSEGDEEAEVDDRIIAFNPSQPPLDDASSAEHAAVVDRLDDALFGPRTDDCVAPPGELPPGVLPPGDPPATTLALQNPNSSVPSNDEVTANLSQQWDAFLGDYVSNIHEPPVSPPALASSSAEERRPTLVATTYMCQVCDGTGRHLQEVCLLCGGCVDEQGNVLDPDAFPSQTSSSSTRELDRFH